MANLNEKSSPVQVMNAVRKDTFDELVSLLSKYYEIGQTGDSTLVIKVADAPTGEPVYCEISPVIKNFKTRITKTKTITPFDFDIETKAFKDKVEERKNKADVIAKKKAEKIAKDKERREKAKQEKENSNN